MTKKRNRVRFLPLSSVRTQALETSSRKLIAQGILNLRDGTETVVTLSPEAMIGLCGKTIVMVDDPALDSILLRPRTMDERWQVAEYLHSK